MSLCSDVYITLEEARKRVRSKLLYEQELLVDKAIQSMDTEDLTSHLNFDTDLYYYNIESTNENINETD